MPDINDFKILAKKSEKYADLLLSSLDSDIKIEGQKTKERIGFYLFILENICGLQDIPDLKELITDTEFNSLISNRKTEDCGIDAIHIDEDESIINLLVVAHPRRIAAAVSKL